MGIIKSHDITLYGGNNINIVLSPLYDEHLPLLYKWYADPEAFCFLIEVNSTPIGECWLQKMNLPDVKAMYPETLDVRRIDMSIGEKAYWNKGIGTQSIGMMIDFAFCGEYVDVLHCFCEDDNIRSRRICEKHGFTQVLESQPQKGRWQCHYRLTRQEFIERCRVKVPADQRFTFPLAELQPSQLYISEGKLMLVREWFTPDDKENFDPIPVKRLDGRVLMTDGHTRAVAAYLAGWDSVPVYWDEDDLDMHAYEIDVNWCKDEGIISPIDLSKRIVPYKDYERLWKKRCMEITI